MCKPSVDQIQHQVAAALQEDIAAGDLTAGLIPGEVNARATIIARQQAVFCGLDWCNAVFQQLDPSIQIDWQLADGDKLQQDRVVCLMQGPAQALLTGERTALNFIQTLSGTATQAARYVQAIAGTGARILDTRKTLPGLRLAQKYAVSCGGASNHRMGLYDAILIKENHIQAAGSISQALAAAQKMVQQCANDVWIEIEVENLTELNAALNAGAKRILLDNFDLPMLREAVAMNQNRARLEASGGVNLDTLRATAETGVDDISVGSITKDVQSVDFSMRFI